MSQYNIVLLCTKKILWLNFDWKTVPVYFVRMPWIQKNQKRLADHFDDPQIIINRDIIIAWRSQKKVFRERKAET